MFKVIQPPTAGWPSVCCFKFICLLTDTVLVYRVHWLRAKAKRDRAHEQITLLPLEMQWTIAYFKRQADVWTAHIDTGPAVTLGHISYAWRQTTMWKSFAEHAELKFVALRPSTLSRTG